MADNRGAQALRALLRKHKQSEIAARLDMSQSHVSRLSRAEDKPALRKHALALKSEGIEVEWWDEPPLPESPHGEDAA